RRAAADLVFDRRHLHVGLVVVAIAAAVRSGPGDADLAGVDLHRLAAAVGDGEVVTDDGVAARGPQVGARVGGRERRRHVGEGAGGWRELHHVAHVRLRAAALILHRDLDVVNGAAGAG